MNPYRAAENTLAGLVILSCVAILGALAWLITITELWKGVGITMLVIITLFGGALLQAEWPQFQEWWKCKRDEWDSKHSSADGDRNA